MFTSLSTIRLINHPSISLGQCMFYLLTGEQQYLTLLTDYLDWLKNGATYTPEGLVHLDAWGANRHAANVAFLSLWVRLHFFLSLTLPPSLFLFIPIFSSHKGWEGPFWSYSFIFFSFCSSHFISHKPLCSIATSVSHNRQPSKVSM